MKKSTLKENLLKKIYKYLKVQKFTSSTEDEPLRYLNHDRCVLAPRDSHSHHHSQQLPGKQDLSISHPEANSLERRGPFLPSSAHSGDRGLPWVWITGNPGPSSPCLVHGVTVTHGEEQAERTPGICAPQQALRS